MKANRFILAFIFNILLISQWAWAEAVCTAYRPEPLVPSNKALCQSLQETIRDPSAFRLDKYEAMLNQFFSNYCHRDVENGWVSDKFLRSVGSFTTNFSDGNWEHGQYDGFHAPVVIWYSPDAYQWIRKNRSDENMDVSNETPIPDGAMIIKEMFNSPSSSCRSKAVVNLYPENGAAIMVREAEASHDGWFWGYYGWPTEENPFMPDWPPAPSNSIANMGFGQYCMNCHASAENQFTFSSAANITGEPGAPISYLSQDFNLSQKFADGSQVNEQSIAEDNALHETVANGSRIQSSNNTNRNVGLTDLIKNTNTDTINIDDITMPSQTYDNVWMEAGKVSHHGQYVTSDQCLGCHDAGSTGLKFDMTMPDNQDSGKLLNFSPYATWRTSPMGLAGRDPIFFAQMASETQTFHSDSKSLVETTCLGCHGILGQRQYQIDHYEETGTCADFERSIINATPLNDDKHADYGALARDGISCTSCHHMVLGEKALSYKNDIANKCVAERQNLLNPDNHDFAKTFSGSFFVGPADKLYGPFKNPQPKPMQNALGITPEHNSQIQTSEICGTCHNVHLPVLKNGKTLAYVYEQTTYSEWLFSAFRTGVGVDEKLPAGPGEKAAECQFCHMPNQTSKGTLFKSKIASIQERTGFPQTAFALAAEDIDLEIREAFAKHTLVGLNLYLLEMFAQFPKILGVATQDPMLVSRGLDPIELSKREMQKNALSETATLAITNVDWDSVTNKLTTSVNVKNHIGHKFPSGVGFRRAFIHFEVINASGDIIWQSGNTNDGGVIVDEDNDPVTGELWWKDDCSPIDNIGDRPHQPHYQIIKHQNEVQIYQELVSTPGENGSTQCSHDAKPAGQLTTSFLSICAEVKDNRLLPQGFLPLDQRIAIAQALGAGKDLAEDSGTTAVGDDPDYVNGGDDNIAYQMTFDDAQIPSAVRARLYYQAIPPFYLQDRACTAAGNDRDRLWYLSNKINLHNTAVEGWKLQIGATANTRMIQ